MTSDFDMTIGIPGNPYDPKRSDQFFYELEVAFRNASFNCLGMNQRGYRGFPPLDDFTDHCLTAIYCAAKLHRLPTDFWNSEEARYVNMQVQSWGKGGYILKEAAMYTSMLRWFFEEKMGPASGTMEFYDWDHLRDEAEQVERIIRTYMSLHRRGIV